MYRLKKIPSVVKNGLVLMVFMALSLSASSQTDFEKRLLDKGIDLTNCEDLSGVAAISIEEPSCALVNITGIDKMPKSKTSEMLAWMEIYDGNGHYFKKRVVLSAQGNYSIRYPKKNIKVDFYEDYEKDKTTDIEIGKWVSQDGFHLKAYYGDYFRGLGTVAYKLFDQFQRDRIPYWQREGIEGESKARCYPDGFPAEVYLNGKFYGLYAWQLKKHRSNMNMKKSAAEHIHLDGDIRDTFLLKGKIDWTHFEVRNPKGLCCTDVVEMSGYIYVEITDNEEELAAMGDSYVDAPSNPKDMDSADLTSESPLYYKYITSKGKTKYYKLTEQKGFTYAEYDGDHPKELIDETMPYYDESNASHVLTAKVKASIVKLSNYYNEVKELADNGASKEEVRAAFEERFDIDSWMDYQVFLIFTLNGDGIKKNWQWFTYDGEKWMVAPYDLDSTFGNNIGGTLRPADSYLNTCSGSIPFDLFAKYYKEDYINRYKELRENGVLTKNNVRSLVDNWYGRFGEFNYEREKETWREDICYDELTCAPEWRGITDYSRTEYWSLPDYSETKAYQPGDRCKAHFVIFEAIEPSTGIQPWVRLSHTDGIERIHSWIDNRFDYVDGQIGLLSPIQTAGSYTLTISSAGWSTICLPISFSVPADLQAFVITGKDENDKLTKEKVDACEAYKPYLVKGAPGTYLLNGILVDNVDTSQEDALKNGWLTGTLEDDYAMSGSYVLQSQNGVLAFYKVKKDGVILVRAYKGILNIPSSESLSHSGILYIDGDTETSVTAGQMNESEVSRVVSIYSVDGSQRSDYQKGINIVKCENGKIQKVMVKE